MIRVGFIIKCVPSVDHMPLIGGSTKAPYRILKYIAADSDIRIMEVLAFEGAAPANPNYRISIIRPRLKLYLKTLYQNISCIPHLIRMFRTCEVIQCHHPHYGLSAALLKSFFFTSKTLIVKAHGTALPEVKANKYKGPKQWLLLANAYLHLFHDRLVLKAATHCLCSSKYQREEMLNLYKVEPDKVSTIYNGYDQQYFHPELERGIETQGIDIAFCGRLVPKKGTQYCIQLCNALRKNGHNVKLHLILGSRNGIEDQSTWETVQKACADEQWINIHFDLTELQLGKLFRKCKIGLVTSKNYESIPSVIYEMLASGIKVFATYKWGIPEILPKDSALLCDLDKDAKAIDHFLLAKHEMSTNDQNYTTYSYSNLANQYINLYK